MRVVSVTDAVLPVPGSKPTSPYSTSHELGLDVRGSGVQVIVAPSFVTLLSTTSLGQKQLGIRRSVMSSR